MNNDHHTCTVDISKTQYYATHPICTGNRCFVGLRRTSTAFPQAFGTGFSDIAAACISQWKMEGIHRNFTGVMRPTERFHPPLIRREGDIVFVGFGHIDRAKFTAETFKIPWTELHMTGLNVESDGMLEIACIIITDGSVTQIEHKEDMEIAAVVSSAMTQVNNYAIIHTEAYIGRSKVESAAACRAINSTVKIIEHKEASRISNALDIMSKYYIVVDATDNVSSRYMISDCCVVLSKPLISGAALGLEGQLTVYNYNGGTCQCYQRIFPTPPHTTACQRFADSGVLGVGLTLTISEKEAEKEVVEFVKKHVDVDVHAHLIAGNSIYMDLIFFKKYMPDLAAVFSHVVDVSSVKALCIPWYPKDNKKAPKKETRQGAVDDIRESIAELKVFKDNIFKPKSRK